MKKRFTEEQIIGFLREAEAGMPVAELCRKHAFSEASYYLWRSKFGGILPGRIPGRQWCCALPNSPTVQILHLRLLSNAYPGV